MKRRCLLKALPALCLPSATWAQQSNREDLDEQIKREAEAVQYSAQDTILLPIYPCRERAIIDAPFSASFLARAPSEGHEYQIRLWRRPDGSTRSENVLAWAALPVEVGITAIRDYGRMKSFTFVTVGGVLQDGVAEKAIISTTGDSTVQTTDNGSIEIVAARTSGNSLIKKAWQTLESKTSVVLEGVDERPCERLRLESPYGSKTLEVWISEDLQIILKEELRRNGEMQHLYVATNIERSEPDPSLFEPPISLSVSPGERP